MTDDPEKMPFHPNIPTHSVKSYDEFMEILREHERNTSTKYTFVAGVKRFQQKEVLVDDKQRIHWMENIPYFYYGCRLFACHQGKDRNKSQKRKYAIKRNLQASKNEGIKPFRGHQQTKKLNCPVLIRLRRVVKVMIRHPEYPCLERYPNKHMKRVYTLLIRERLNKGKLLCEELYIFNLPKPEEHKYHFVGEEAIAKAISNANSKPKSGKTYCCICKSSRINRNEHIAFHRVPKSEPLLSKWRQIIGKNVKSNLHRVCSEHFPPSQFKKSIMENGKIRKVLLPNSIPRVKKYSQADVECEEPIVTSDEKPQRTIVPLEHLYCALETTDQEVEEGELYYEEVEVAVEDFQMAYVDDITTSGIRQYFSTNTQTSVPEYVEESDQENTQESVPACAEENHPENMEVVSYFEISIPESAEEVEPEYNEESIPENMEESECVESLEEDDIHEEHVVESQKHKRRKLLQNDENYKIIVNDPILIQDTNAALDLHEPIIISRQPLNQINEKKESSLEETNKKHFKNKEELTQDCFTSPEYFQIYRRHKRKLKCEVTHLKSELLELESKYAQLNSFLSRMKEQGIISEPPPEKHLTPLMCCIVDRALSENKPKVTPELKQFSISLMTQSPDTYQFVRSELMNALPEEKTVKWWQKKARLDEKREQEARIYVVKKSASEYM